MTVCLSHAVGQLELPVIETLPLSALVEELQLHEHYFSTIASIIKLRQICRSQLVLDILGIQPFIDSEGNVSPDQLTVRRGSYIGRAYCVKWKTPIEESDVDILIVSEVVLDKLIRSELEAMMTSHLERLHSSLKALKTLLPCSQMVVHGKCADGSCKRDHSAFKQPGYPQLAIRVHLLIIQLMQCLWSLSSNQLWPLRREARRVWIDRLFRALQPSHHLLGCGTGYHDAPELSKTLPIIQTWTSDMILDSRYELFPELAHLFLSDALTWIITMDELDSGRTLPHVYHLPSGFFHRRPRLDRPGSQATIVEDLIIGISPVENQHRLLRGLSAIK